MEVITRFLRTHNISSHTFAALASSFVGLYIADAGVRAFVDGLLVDHPKLVSLLGLAVVVYRNYASSRNKHALERRDDPKPQEEARQ